MLLGSEQVLTCAHVISAGAGDRFPGQELGVDFLGLPGVPAGRARVAAGCWVPPDEAGQGDLALLDLAEPAPDGSGAPLCELPLWRREVYTRGYPLRLDDGVWIGGTLSGSGGPGREWIQLDTPDGRVDRGFSGSAVVDEMSGTVVGIVVGRWRGADAGLAWMIPVHTIVRHLPRVAGHVLPAPPAEVSAAWKVVLFLRGGGPGGIKIVVTGEDGSADSASLSRIFESSGHSARVPDTGGGSDAALALDVSGMSAGQVSRRIEAELGPAPVSDAALMIDGLDDAADPAAVADEVIKPLAERDNRVVVCLRRDSEELRGMLGFPAERRLTALRDRLAEVTAAEHAARERHQYVAARVAPVPAIPAGARKLRLRVSAVRAEAAAGGDVLAELEDCESQAERLLGEAVRTHRHLDELLSERDRLRGLLAAYRHATRPAEPEPGLAALYRRAHGMLARGPCDLPAAAAAVDRYLRALPREPSHDPL
ncbi:trypsin-like peptidase domain-containing protein [Actinomadura graeca]|uniref:Trypsin-like peptidase domain-containing protein n=1 Tax=Actinomadura graeca TaxID=2750812 RepID=A0ABX8R643_9ACTN|nr:serine protease [Actinomadura graeca]QXJ25719.1 trypsin-like peptidase domain-containing protein [Actinomadura graeca]